MAGGVGELDDVCAGSCNAVYVAWTAAATGGDVESYNILYDTDPTSCNGGVPVNFTFAEDAGRNLEGDASLWITPGRTYYFAVQAISKYGNATSNCMSAAVLNTTQPEAPTTLEASGDGTRPEEANQVSLFWPPVTENDDSNKIVPCSTGVSRDTKIMPAAEKRYYRIYKSRNPTVVPGAAGTTEILNEFSPVQPSTVGTNLSFVDTAAANCLPYYYRIMTVDHCFRDASWNTGNNVNLARSTDYFPALGTDGIRGQAADLLVKRGSALGEILYQGTLERGQKQRFDGQVLWVRLESPQNVLVRRNGNKVRLPRAVKAQGVFVTAKKIFAADAA